MTRREVLEKLYEQAFHEDYHHRHSPRHINQALTELDKLEKEKMLRIVGEDNRLVDLLKDILEWDGILQHSKIRIEQAIAKSERR